MKKQKKKTLQLRLNEIKQSNDPTLLPVTFSIIDFEVSNNNAIVSEEVALEAANTLLNKPIVTRYYQVEEPGSPTDALGSHEEFLSTNRNGEQRLKLNTTPIGTFTTPGYKGTIQTEDGEKEVLLADGVLWKSRFPDACELLKEWHVRGIEVHSSCEFLYENYSFVDGVEHILSPIIFDGHCVLNSENRGNHSIVLPAYDSSKLVSFNEFAGFERLVAQALNQNNTKESEKVKFKKTFELSHDDIRSKIYEAFSEKLAEQEDVWISDTFDNYFIANIYSWSEDDAYDKYFKFNYSKSESAVEIDFDSKTEVFLKRNWEEVVPQETQNLLNQKDTEISELTSKLNSAQEDKASVEAKFNGASEKLVSLNQAVTELKPYKEKYESEKLEQKLNSQKEHYEGKFTALNAKEQYETEEVQTLVAQSANEGEEASQATMKLNSMLVELVTVKAEEAHSTATLALNSTRQDLIPAENDFFSRFSE
ncbi:hypothetical protein SAMN05421503_1435 [Terribacillus aidingensis]|uniref:Uncharacterized protein n=1 Tax=Terribacillus aidingensis TaxID=586416 RepID=A0A285NKA4_9BACI|nr:hypothetical protein [Terribacillus aidingensis]SNZ09954.1 hypothetical protein SAMN05421503_1435 [Terribacillus aidingensis]